MQGINYEIGNSTSMDTALVTLNISKLRPGYMVTEKRSEKSCSLYIFSIQTSESSLFLFVDQNDLRTYN